MTPFHSLRLRPLVFHPSPPVSPLSLTREECVVVSNLLGTAEHFTPEHHISHTHMRVLNGKTSKQTHTHTQWALQKDNNHRGLSIQTGHLADKNMCTHICCMFSVCRYHYKER